MRGRLTSYVPTILLAEDDLGDQELIRRALKESGRQCILKIVSDGEEALDYLFRQGEYSDLPSLPMPDIIILDMNMPRMNGAEVIEKARPIESLKHIPIIVLSTSSAPSDIRLSYANGANSYITKPTTIAEFTHVIDGLQQYWFDLVHLPPQSSQMSGLK